MAQTIDNMIVSRIYGRHRGWVFTPMQFLDLGSRMAVDQTLGRLTKAGIIRRLTRGLYDYPVKHPDFGDLPPNYDRVAQALVGRDNLKIQPSGAYAANLLGLTEQVVELPEAYLGHMCAIAVGYLGNGEVSVIYSPKYKSVSPSTNHIAKRFRTNNIFHGNP